MGQSGAIAHNFYDDLDYSNSASDEPFWNAAYKAAFPNMARIERHPNNPIKQRIEIDTTVTLLNGEIIKVDEKKRRRPYEGDILLEYISNDKKNTPGWMEKDLNIQYIAYAFIPSRRCYFFDWPLLRHTWIRFKNDWLAKYISLPSVNQEYNTINVAIPTNDLMWAMANTSIVQL